VFYVQGFTGSNLFLDFDCVDVVYTHLSRLKWNTLVFYVPGPWVRILSWHCIHVLMSFTTLVLHAPTCPDRQYNLINIVRRIATCMEVSKTDYMYQAMFNDRNLTLFWRYDIRLMDSSITIPSMGVAKNIFLNFFYFSFHPPLCLPTFIPSTISYFSLSYLCISVSCKHLFL
jgi:hypothetical protein